jgi:hypothetical protein
VYGLTFAIEEVLVVIGIVVHVQRDALERIPLAQLETESRLGDDDERHAVRGLREKTEWETELTEGEREEGEREKREKAEDAVSYRVLFPVQNVW